MRILYFCAVLIGGLLSVATGPLPAGFRLSAGLGTCAVVGFLCCRLYRQQRKKRAAEATETPDDLAALALTPEEKTRLRLEIFRTACGRLDDWHVEVNGKPLALLTDAGFEDMFWFSYRVEPLTKDATERLLLRTQQFWTEQNPVFRNVRLGLTAARAFTALTEPYRDGRLHIRGLYFSIPGPTRQEKALLAAEQQKSKKR